jgi:hypothetical protein
MVLIFIALLLVSIAGISGVLFLKHRELSTGNVVMAGFRPHADRFFHSALFWIERVIPTLARVWSAHVLRGAMSAIQRSIAAAILYIEQVLARVLAKLRRSTEVRHEAGEASPFLRAIAEHKKALSVERSIHE